MFAAILDDEKGGRFYIKPEAAFNSEQTYITNTNILQTTFQTADGQAVVTDFMPCYRTSNRSLVQPLQIHRKVQCTKGKINLEAVFEPRLDYAQSNTALSASKYGITAMKGSEVMSLSSKIVFTMQQDRAFAQLTLEQGQRTEFILCYETSKPLSPALYRSDDKLEKTETYWKRLADACLCSSIWDDAIIRSYLTLHLLIYQPTGAIIAAPTASLPEEIGGERNWDYRYAWLRDASLTLDAFNRLGHKEEAVSFFKWLLEVCHQRGPGGQILYSIDLENPVDERILGHLRGYRDSRPVRIGNDAYHQRQLDVFGEVLEAAYNYFKIGGYISRDTWKLLEDYINAACKLWQEPDSGIWEVRSGPYHFVHSKLMCWVALDRGIKIAEELGYGRKHLQRWRKNLQDICEDILTRGWNPKKRAFTQHYDTLALDSSNLFIPIYGLLPISDERVQATIERTVEELSWNGLLRRYSTEKTADGLSGSEGAFTWCSFWLVRNLIRLGRLDDAVALFEKLLSYRNHLGLFSEMVDPESREALGNFPQALTHLAVIVTGMELIQAMKNSTR